jgi:hypothetical protein
MWRLVHILASALSVFALGACFNRVDPDVQERYQRKAQEIGLNAVYPPQEDIQVGDVFLVSTNVRKSDDVVRIYLTSLPGVLSNARANLGSRIAFKDSTFADGKKGTSSDATLAAAQTDFTGSNPLTPRGLQNVDSLPVAAYPSITTDAGFSINGAVANALSGFGILGGGRTTVTLDYKEVRTYGANIPEIAGPAQQELLNFITAKGNPTPECQNYVRYLHDKLDPRLSHTRRAYSFMVVSRVFLTRSIDYRYNSKVIAAAARSQRASGATPNSGAFAGATIIAPAISKVPTAADDLVAAIQAARSQSNAAPGSGAQIGAFNELGLTLTRTFLRPVVIAWEGLPYRFEDFEFCHDAIQ